MKRKINMDKTSESKFKIMFLKLVWKNTDKELHSNENKQKKEFECPVSNYKILSLGFQLGEREICMLAHSLLLLENIMQLCCTGLECVFSLGVEQRTC